MLLSRITTLLTVNFIIKLFRFYFKSGLLKMYLLFLDIITMRLPGYSICSPDL